MERIECPSAAEFIGIDPFSLEQSDPGDCLSLFDSSRGFSPTPGGCLLPVEPINSLESTSDFG